MAPIIVHFPPCEPLRIGPGTREGLERFADLIRLVAALPQAGAVVLVSSARERAEVKDLILQHRGTAVCDGTRVAIGASAKAETEAAAGNLTTMVFLAPGYMPKAPPDFYQGALEFNVQGGWWRRTSPDVLRAVRTVSLPPCWEEASPGDLGSTVAGPTRNGKPVFASVKLGPLPGAAADGRGPWHKPQSPDGAELPDPIVTITMRYEHGAVCPYVLRAWLAPACITAIAECFATQEAADAALPAFAVRARAATAAIPQPVLKDAA